MSHVREVFRAALQAASPVPFFETIGVARDLNKVGDSWVTIAFPISQAERISLGFPACFRESGTVGLHALARSGRGETDVMLIADTLRAAFDVARIDDVRLLGTSPPVLIPTDDGEWLDVVVSVSYEWDYVVNG